MHFIHAHARISIKTCNTDSLLILYIISVSLPLSFYVLHRNLILLTIQRKWSEIKMNIKNVISFIGIIVLLSVIDTIYPKWKTGLFDFVLYIQTIDKYNQIKKQKNIIAPFSYKCGPLITEWRTQKKTRETRKSDDRRQKTRDCALAHKKNIRENSFNF